MLHLAITRDHFYNSGNTQPLPTPGGHADGVFAVFWSDLDINPHTYSSVDAAGANQASGVYVGARTAESGRSGLGRRVTVSYIRVPYCCSGLGPRSTFQYILHADGRMVFQYKELQGPPPAYAALSIGFESGDGRQGAQLSYGWFTRPGDGSAVEITFRALQVSF